MGPERRIGKGGSGPVEGPVTRGRGAEGRIGFVEGWVKRKRWVWERAETVGREQRYSMCLGICDRLSGAHLGAMIRRQMLGGSD